MATWLHGYMAKWLRASGPKGLRPGGVTGYELGDLKSLGSIRRIKIIYFYKGPSTKLTSRRRLPASRSRRAFVRGIRNSNARFETRIEFLMRGLYVRDNN